MDDSELKNIIEALLMSSSSPLPLEQLMQAFEAAEKPSAERLKHILSSLREDYQSSAVELKLLAGGYVFQTKAVYSPWIARMQAEKPAKYSRALLETLAIVAYKQPVTRADIEDIRGVTVHSQMMKTLLEREWIKIAGHRDVPGKPAVYITTTAFLDHFNLKNLGELPELDKVNDFFTSQIKLTEKGVQLNEQ